MIVVNLVSGPGTGKSILAARLFAELKMRGLNVEYVSEYAKQLTWLKEYELLHNQHHVSHQQYRMLDSLKDSVDIIVTDGSLLHGLVYNIIDRNNTSNIDKTANSILNWFNQFNNIVVYLERDLSFNYQQAGRTQTLEEAIHIDNLLKYVLFDNKIEYRTWKVGDKDINPLVEEIESQISL
jgi:hypothetical protein